MKNKVLISAVLTIALCVSLVCGATFALFTSQSQVNIAVTSGKVDVVASVSDLEAYSPTSVAGDGTLADDTNLADNTAEEKLFANGGSAALDENVLTLTNVTPGDKVTFNINVVNNSNVKALYRIVVGCQDNDGLFEGLQVNFVDATGIDFAQNVAGITAISKYALFTTEGEEKTIKMSLELPASAGNEYTGKTCSVSFKVEALQGNSAVSDAPAGTLELYSASDLVSYAKLEAACVDADSVMCNYTTIKLMNDVDFGGADWTPIMTRNNTLGQPVYNTEPIIFDGNGHTVSNFNAVEVYDGSNYYSGFFGEVISTTIQNLTVDHATINSTHYAAGIAAQLLYKSKVLNCNVTNTTITSTPEDYNKDGNYDNGDKVGGIVGHCQSNGAVISNCLVEKCSITGYRDIGGIGGYAAGDLTIENCTVKDTTITSDHTYNYKQINRTEDLASLNIHEIVGRYGNTITETSNTYTNVTIVNEL